AGDRVCARRRARQQRDDRHRQQDGEHGGSSAARLTSLVSSCNFPINLPTSTCIAVPMGGPVLIGGPAAMDKMAAVTRGIRTKWFSNALHKVLKPGKRLSKFICFLTGHPVDVVTPEHPLPPRRCRAWRGSWRRTPRSAYRHCRGER